MVSFESVGNAYSEEESFLLLVSTKEGKLWVGLVNMDIMEVEVVFGLEEHTEDTIDLSDCHFLFARCLTMPLPHHTTQKSR